MRWIGLGTLAIVLTAGCVPRDDLTQRSHYYVELATEEATILGIEVSEENETVDATYVGDWQLNHVHPYLILVDGDGEIFVRGSHFRWSRHRLTLESNKQIREFGSGDSVMVGIDGTIRVGPSFN